MRFGHRQVALPSLGGPELAALALRGRFFPDTPGEIGARVEISAVEQLVGAAQCIGPPRFHLDGR